jgi:hypothetical protein
MLVLKVFIVCIYFSALSAVYDERRNTASLFVDLKDEPFALWKRSSASRLVEKPSGSCQENTVSNKSRSWSLQGGRLVRILKSRIAPTMHSPEEDKGISKQQETHEMIGKGKKYFSFNDTLDIFYHKMSDLWKEGSLAAKDSFKRTGIAVSGLPMSKTLARLHDTLEYQLPQCVDYLSQYVSPHQQLGLLVLAMTQPQFSSRVGRSSGVLVPFSRWSHRCFRKAVLSSALLSGLHLAVDTYVRRLYSNIKPMRPSADGQSIAVVMGYVSSYDVLICCCVAGLR